MPSTKLQQISIQDNKCSPKGDQVMVFLRQERFLVGTYIKLQSKKYARTRLSRRLMIMPMWWRYLYSIRISKTFNVADLYPYYSSEDPLYLDVPTNSRSSFSQVGETNVEEVTFRVLGEDGSQLKKLRPEEFGRLPGQLAQFDQPLVYQPNWTETQRRCARFLPDFPVLVSGRLQTFSDWFFLHFLRL